MKPTLAISIGDFNGIGPEVILKTLNATAELPFTPVILGHPVILDYYAMAIGQDKLDYHILESSSQIRPGEINVMVVDEMSEADISPGSVSKQAGALAMKAVYTGIQLCLSGEVNGLVTAPISKEAIHLAGYHVPGHTEYLAQETQCQDYVMMLVSKTLRVGLISTHIPLHQAAAAVTRQSILKQLRTITNSLKEDFGITQPAIAVLGLNPHAGDGGVLGTEETDIISPAIVEAASKLDTTIEGPFPADGFFGSKSYERYDAVLAMYHDQGLVPFKTISFNAGVNFTAGLPIIRTSPDHGTAFSIAGKGIASNQSFHEAVELATLLSGKKMSEHPPST